MDPNTAHINDFVTDWFRLQHVGPIKSRFIYERYLSWCKGKDVKPVGPITLITIIELRFDVINLGGAVDGLMPR